MLIGQLRGWAAEAGDGKHAPSSENLPELPLYCMRRREQCPWRFLPQNQLMFSQPDVVGGIWLPVIKLKEFQWACKFESKENSNQLWRTNVDRHSFFLMSTAYGCGAPWFGMICKESSSSRGTRRDCVPGIPPTSSSSPEHHTMVWQRPLDLHRDNFHFVQVSNFVLLANSCSVKKSLLVLFVKHKHSHGNPSC